MTPPHTPDPGKPSSSASFLPFCSQHYLGLLLSLLFSCVNIFEKTKQSEIKTRSATGFLFPPPRVERGLDWIEGGLKVTR